MIIPKRRPGKQSKEAKYNYQVQCEAFAEDIKAIQAGIDFKISARGWCYYLEGLNLIHKGEFDIAEGIINDMRKNGLLPVDFTAKDKARSIVGEVREDYNAEEELSFQRRKVINFIKRLYTPHLLSDTTNIYMEVIVEKVDLVGLFRPVCKEYQIPITNLKGWSDINSRADIIKRCYEKYQNGCDVTLLYCGDFDPAGIYISNVFKKNLRDLENALDIDTNFINFRRFGLEYDYIVDNDLLWTDNLKTGSGKDLSSPRHKDHHKDYVQKYLKMYGVRKVEANAMLKDVPVARELMLTTIKSIVRDDELEDYQESLIEPRDELLELLNEKWPA